MLRTIQRRKASRRVSTQQPERPRHSYCLLHGYGGGGARQKCKIGDHLLGALGLRQRAVSLNELSVGQIYVAARLRLGHGLADAKRHVLRRESEVSLRGFDV